MNLTEGLPQGFAVKAYEIEIESGALFWMQLSEKLENAPEEETAEALTGAIKSISRAGAAVPLFALGVDDARRIYDRLVWFMLGGEDVAKRTANTDKRPKERLLSYSADIAAIYAAVMQVYGIDLYATDKKGHDLIETMHWWKFKALLDNLPDGNKLTDFYIRFRSMDLSKLPGKSNADREYYKSVASIKDMVALDRPQAEKRESWLDKRARELKQEKAPTNEG